MSSIRTLRRPFTDSSVPFRRRQGIASSLSERLLWQASDTSCAMQKHRGMAVRNPVCAGCHWHGKDANGCMVSKTRSTPLSEKPAPLAPQRRAHAMPPARGFGLLRRGHQALLQVDSGVTLLPYCAASLLMPLVASHDAELQRYEMLADCGLQMASIGECSGC